MVMTVQFMDLMEKGFVLLLRLHLDDNGQHPEPHRRVRHKPDGRSNQNREDRAGEKVPQADVTEEVAEDNLRRDRRGGEKRDEAQSLDPAIVNRDLGQVEEPVIPFAEALHAIPETGSSGSYKSLGGQVSKLKKVPEPVRPFPRVAATKFRGAPLTDLGRSAN